MKIKNLQKNKGFVLLFAVTLTAIFLSIALGVANVAYREVKFSTNTRSSNDAFYSADTGIECVLFHDKPAGSVFTTESTSPFDIDCVGTSITVTKSSDDPDTFYWDFTVPPSGGSQQGCAKVHIKKYQNSETEREETTITSKGYNVGGSSCDVQPNSVEREIETYYEV